MPCQHHVDAGVGERRCAGISCDKGDVGAQALGLAPCEFEHARRRVDAHHLVTELHEQCGHGPGATAEIRDDGGWRREHLLEDVPPGPSNNRVHQRVVRLIVELIRLRVPNPRNIP